MTEAVGATGQTASLSLTESIIILLPALGCPGIVNNGELGILVLLKNADLAKSEYLADRLRYLPWDDRDSDPEGGAQLTAPDIRIGNYATDFEPFNHVSPTVLTAHYNAGFTQVVYASCRIQETEGLYTLATPYHEAAIACRAIQGLPRPYDDCPMMPDRGINQLDGTPLNLHHPFLVTQASSLGIAHITDTHVDCRWELLDARAKGKIKGFNNYNTRFVESLQAANDDGRVHIIVITGDLIDYNRGHNGGQSNDLFTDYQYNRNWLLFHKLLLENYRKPVFTVLGNHDYRLNPYSPMPRILNIELYSISYDMNLLRSEVEQIHENVHDIETGKDGNLYTTYESVTWYSLVINPLFDYSFPYKDQAFLMLDWNKEEDIEDNLPWADEALSDKQQQILGRWLEATRGKVKIVGMHAPVYNPFPETGNDFLKDGVIDDSSVWATKTMPIKIFKDWADNRNELVDGTFREGRNEFIRQILDNPSYAEDGSHVVGPNMVQLILTGHAHRNGIYQIVGDRVKLTQFRDQDSWDPGLPIFVDTVSAGPLGFDNESGRSVQSGGLGHRYLVRPGFRVILLDQSGKVGTLERVQLDKVTVRATVNAEFKG